MKRLLLFLIVPALVAAFALTSDTSYSKGPPDKVLPEYLALGDSLGVGVGATNPATKGYVPRFRDFLESKKGLDTDLFLNNLAVSGETTTSMINEGQLDEALAELQDRNGDKNPNNNVEVVTVDIGGNDVFALIPVVLAEPDCAGGLTLACLIAIAPAIGGTFATFSANFDTILDELRDAAGPDTTIIVMTYFNSLVNPGCIFNSLEPLGDIALEGDPLLAPFGLSDGLNDLIRLIAADPDHNAKVAELVPGGVFPVLLGPADIQPDCLHPKNNGYKIIAGEFKAAFTD